MKYKTEEERKLARKKSYEKYRSSKKYKEVDKKYRQSREVKQQRAEYRKTDVCKETSARYRRKLKYDVITAYGGKCECCGTDIIEFLTIDHINGNGANHRKQLGSNGSAIYRYLRQNNYPKGEYRVLCMNCNFSIGAYGYCPHQEV